MRDQIITAMDWFPTVLELCGVKQDSGSPALDGYSLLPLIESAQAESAYHGVLHFAWGNQWAVREGDWKLIGVQPRNSDEPKLSLHNLSDAEPEVKNYVGEKPEVVARLRGLHEAWKKEVEPNRE